MKLKNGLLFLLVLWLGQSCIMMKLYAEGEDFVQVDGAFQHILERHAMGYGITSGFLFSGVLSFLDRMPQGFDMLFSLLSREGLGFSIQFIRDYMANIQAHPFDVIQNFESAIVKDLFDGDQDHRDFLNLKKMIVQVAVGFLIPMVERAKVNHSSIITDLDVFRSTTFAIIDMSRYAWPAIGSRKEQLIELVYRKINSRLGEAQVAYTVITCFPVAYRVYEDKSLKKAHLVTQEYNALYGHKKTDVKSVAAFIQQRYLDDASFEEILSELMKGKLSITPDFFQGGYYTNQGNKASHWQGGLDFNKNKSNLKDDIKPSQRGIKVERPSIKRVVQKPLWD